MVTITEFPESGNAEVSVVVVGAGPVGLTMASLLAAYGIDVLVIERLPSTIDEPRAVSIDDESLRSMQAIGLIDAIEPTLHSDYGSLYLDQNGRKIAFVHPTTREFGYPRRNGFRQEVLVDQLANWIQSSEGGNLFFGHDLAAFNQSADHVHLVVRRNDGSTMDVTCKYLIGCDGAKSDVRRSLGFEMRGESYGKRWLIIDILETKDTFRHTRVFCNPKRPGITLPGPNGTRRFEFMLHPGEDEDAMRSESVVRDLMETVGPDRDAPIRRRAIYTFHARIVEQWRKGRVFLAGDAAHLSPPFAGQGMNSGIRDCQNLSWKLAAVIHGTLGPHLLDTYQNERAPHAAELIRMAQRMGRVMMPRSAVSSFFVRTFFTAISIAPPVKRYFSEMRYKPRPRLKAGFFASRQRRSRGQILPGHMFPQPRLETKGGSMILLDEALGNGFSMLAYSCKPEHAFDTVSAWTKSVSASRVCVIPGGSEWVSATGVTTLRDSDGVIDKIFGGQLDMMAAIRPDRYVVDVIDGRRSNAVQAIHNLTAGSVTETDAEYAVPVL